MHFKETLKMFCTNPSELLSRLGKGEVSNLYYIYGNDISGVQKLTRDMLKILTEGNEDFSLTRLNGRNVNTSELYDTVQLMPMMSEYNCIFINDYNCEKPLDNMQGRKAEDLNKNLIDVLKSVPPQTVIIFNVTGFEIKMKFDRKSNSYIIADKNKKLFDYILFHPDSRIKFSTPTEYRKTNPVKIPAYIQAGINGNLARWIGLSKDDDFKQIGRAHV